MSNPRIRPARATDRPAVEAICAQRDEDYIPREWDGWLADPHGALAVAEVDGRAVAFAKLSRLAEDEWWLKGVRVDQAYRRRGIAGRLVAHLVETARQAGCGTLRLGTHAHNEPMHRIAARCGFRHLATYLRYQAASLFDVGARPLCPLTEADLPVAWTLTSGSPRYRAAGGMVESFWTWKNLTRERLASHLANGDGWGLGYGAELAGLALVYRTEENMLNAGYVDGREDALVSLLRGLRRLAADLGDTQVRFKPVDEPGLVAAVDAAGYERIRDRNLWIFESRLSDAHGIGKKPG
jgi:RimJ/RimL family protein N-acetyltransferase